MDEKRWNVSFVKFLCMNLPTNRQEKKCSRLRASMCIPMSSADLHMLVFRLLDALKFVFFFFSFYCLCPWSHQLVMDISKDSHLGCKIKYEVSKSQSEDFVTL